MKVWLAKILKYAVLVICFSWLQAHIYQWTHSETVPAGLVSGVVDGILMPTALPALLFGKDMLIYAMPNTGLTYKLGYTLGVNGCGAVFFGILFLRVSRWHSTRAQRDQTAPIRDPQTR